MRILHALAQRPGRTGSGVFLQQLFKTGLKKGFEQGVIAGVPFDNQEPDIDNLDEKNFFPILFETNELNFPVVGMSDVMPYKSTKYSDMNEDMYKAYEKAFKKVIKKAVEEFNPDLVICNHIWLLSTFIKDLYPNLKVLTLCHGTDLRQLELSKQLAYIVKEKVVRGEYFFALNSIQAQKIKEVFNVRDEQVITSGSGYNPDMFFPIKREKNKKIKVVYVGKMSNAKGVPQLLNAFENSKSFENMQLNLIGSGSGIESENILESIKTRKSEINYLGRLEQKELEKFLRTSDIFILPSFYEGLPLVVIEAIASGTKVICTDLPGLDNFLGDRLKELKAIRYVKMPRLKSIDTPYIEDIESFEEELSEKIDEVANEFLSNMDYEIDEVMKLLEDKTWDGLFNRLEKYF